MTAPKQHCHCDGYNEGSGANATLRTITIYGCNEAGNLTFDVAFNPHAHLMLILTVSLQHLPLQLLSPLQAQSLRPLPLHSPQKGIVSVQSELSTNLQKQKALHLQYYCPLLT